MATELARLTPEHPARDTATLRVGICCDFPEERWISMDLVGEMLLAELGADRSLGIDATAIRPRLPRRLSRVFHRSRRSFNADRFLGRFRDYPRIVRAMRGQFDVFHVIDHSYAHLVNDLPPGRTVVTCHDLDAFRLALAPEASRGAPVLTAMARRSLAGLKAAARVICVSDTVRAEIVEMGLIPSSRVSLVPNGVHPALSPEPDPRADNELSTLIGEPSDEVTELLHVGSTIPRKRIDILLQVIATLRRGTRPVRLLRVGGDLEPDQRRLARELGVEDAVISLPFLAPPVLAAVYRRAAVVLQPSDAEGFGLPIVEAMACGTPVVATDLAVLREVGGDAAIYCRRGEIDAWATTIRRLVTVRDSEPELWDTRRRRGIARAKRFSWQAHAEAMAEIYRAVDAAASS